MTINNIVTIPGFQTEDLNTFFQVADIPLRNRENVISSDWSSSGLHELNKTLDRINNSIFVLVKEYLSVCISIYRSTKIFEVKKILENKYNHEELDRFLTIDFNNLEISDYYSPIEFISDVSHKLLYKTIRLANGRFVTIPKNNIPKDIILNLGKVLSNINIFFSDFYLKNPLIGFTKFTNCVYGSNSRKTHIHNFETHKHSESIITMDVSKFFPSTRFTNTVSNDIVEKIFYHQTRNLIKKGNCGPEEKGRILDAVDNSMVVFKMFLSILFFNDRVPTGAPYSSSLSNFLFSPIDYLIVKEIFRHIRLKHKQEKRFFKRNILFFIEESKKIERGFSFDDLETDVSRAERYFAPKHNNAALKYTRYVDDITISSRKEKSLDGSTMLNMDFVKKIEKILVSFGYHLNYSKTKIYGKKDPFVINGISGSSRNDYSDNTVPRLSVIVPIVRSFNSDKKFALAMEVSGKKYSELTSSQLGLLNYIKRINHTQYRYVLSKLSDYPECLRKINFTSSLNNRRRMTARYVRRINPVIQNINATVSLSVRGENQ